MLLYNALKFDVFGFVTEEDEEEIDPFGRTEEELQRLEKADFDWKQMMEDSIGKNR